MKKEHIVSAITGLAIAGTLATYSATAAASGFIDRGHVAVGASAGPSEADKANAKSRLPMLTDASQLPAEVRETLGIGDGGVETQGFGTANHPFTTKRAATKIAPASTIKRFPYSATGKLWMRFGSSWYVCTASVIEKGVLVSAAHCVWDYGGSPADEVYFEPARHGTSTPYGQWQAVNFAVPSVYSSGTDVCTVAGVVCENDLAVIVLDTDGGGKYIKQVVKGEYGWAAGGYGYVKFKGKQSAQITEFGYPVAFDSGLMMIRTDSLGYWADPKNVIIGTDQTGGSSGGPWLINFGMNPVSASSTPSENNNNRVVATTSWGYVDSTVKVQGASRFSKNTAFPTQPNIKAALDWACSSYPTHCD